MSDYNGWTNYETWNVKLWLDNEEYLQDWQEEITQESRKIENRFFNRLTNSYRDVKFELADMVKEYVTDPDNGLIPDLGATMASDLLGSALDNVNWIEIAENMLSDYEEENEDDESYNEPSEPEEGDYTSEDHCKWYQFGKLAVTVSIDGDYKQALREHMEQEQYWPNVWFISDHGNAHLITLQESN